VASLTIDSASNFISETARAGLRGKDYEARKERLPKREDRFIDAVLNADPPITFDCIILDEAQDIRKSDVDLFELVLRPASEGGTMLVFGDPNQQLALRRSGSALDVQQGGLKLDLDVNCRNTYEIAKVAHTFTSQPVETLETRSGIKIRSRESSDNLGDLVRHEIVAIRNEFDPHSLAILTLNGISDIADNDPYFVDGWRREMQSRKEGDKDVDARVYAIQAFQGREADAVIVALSENSLLKTYPFERFFKEIEGIRPPTPRQNGVVDDLRRVWSQYERFVKRVSQELVPEYRGTLEQTEGLMSPRKIDFLVKEFERCRRREFSPDFRSPWLTEHWERQQTKSLRVALYSMMTRARVVLSIISNSNVKAFIEEKALGVSEDVTELLQDEGD
jgi:hypothetical protein